MFYCIFDTETTGLIEKVPGKRYPDHTELDKYPRIVQLTFGVYLHDGTRLVVYDFVIDPQNEFVISNSFIHGITDERASFEGSRLSNVFELFSRTVAGADVLVAHNVDFDLRVLKSEMHRAGRGDLIEMIDSKPIVCTMKPATPLCCIPFEHGRGGFKYPKLSELYRFLFQREMVDAHNSKYDVLQTAQCFFELKRRGVL